MFADFAQVLHVVAQCCTVLRKFCTFLRKFCTFLCNFCTLLRKLRKNVQNLRKNTQKSRFLVDFLRRISKTYRFPCRPPLCSAGESEAETPGAAQAHVPAAAADANTGHRRKEACFGAGVIRCITTLFKRSPNSAFNNQCFQNFA